MKIQDALTQNKNYWIEQEKALTVRLGTFQEEVQKIANQLNEAQQQIILYDKATEILATLDPVKVDAVKIETSNT